MALFDMLFGRPAGKPPLGGGVLAKVLSGEAVPGENALAEKTAVALHRHGEGSGSLPRRTSAAIAAGRRRSPKELAEALFGLAPFEVTDLLDALSLRNDRDDPGLVAAARTLADKAGSLELLGCTLGLLAFGRDGAEVELLIGAGRSVALARPCAEALARRGEEDAILALARGSSGVGRALALERLGILFARRPELDAADAERADAGMEILAGVTDPVARSYGAVLLLEMGKPASRIPSMSPERLSGVAACLEAAARGGWNGGPGPGLGRMPQAIEAASALLALQGAPPQARRTAALAAMSASPMPPGPVRQLAEAALKEIQGA